MLTPRPYQSAALDALDAHVQTRQGNPCVVIPTGGGKSLLMALAIQRWKEAAPHFRPESVTVVRHKKPGRHDSLRVTYHAGLLRVSEWICLDHPGYAGDKARAWWHQRFPSQPPTVNEALGFLFLPQQILAVTESIEVGREGKYPTIKTATIRRTA